MRYDDQPRWARDSADDAGEPTERDTRPREPRRARERPPRTGSNRTLLFVLGGVGLGFALLGGLVIALIVAGVVYERNTYGKRIELKNESELYYTSGVQEAEAQKLAGHLNDTVLLFPMNKGTFQVSKNADVYEVRVCVQEGKGKDQAVQLYWTAQGRTMSEKVFDKAPVQVILCDTEMKPVHSVPRSDRSK